MSIQLKEAPCPDISDRPCPATLTSGEWPPQWKSIQECPEYFFMGGYLDKVLCFEVDPSSYPFEGEYPIDKYLLFLKQIRESKGYDITVTPPGAIFYPVDLSRDQDSTIWYDDVCKFVVDKINDQAKMYGELYVYHSVVKVVEINCLRCTLFTFDVKDVKSNDLKSIQACILYIDGEQIHVHGWRFKPSFDHPPPPCPKRQMSISSRPPRSPKKQMTIWSRLKKLFFAYLQSGNPSIDRICIDERKSMKRF